MKQIAERNIDSLEDFWEVINYNKQCLNKEDWSTKENWLDFLRSLVNNKYDSLLDIGCHDCSITKDFNIQYKCGVDAFDKISNIASKYCDFKCIDARNIEKYFSEGSFDVVCELDFIEHLNTAEEALKLIFDMEKIAKKLVIHFFPLNVIESENFTSDAYHDMENYSNETGVFFNNLQRHLLQPTKEIFLDKGYNVKLYGGDIKKILAWKYL